MKISFITTVFNEEKSVNALLESLSSQSFQPNEIIIADGGSTDQTISQVLGFQKKTNLKIKLIQAKGNRSVGRNAAIESSTGDIIVCSDAGCKLDKDWIKNIIKPLENGKVDVVAGYYKGISSTMFEKCLIPYVLVMPDRLNSDDFLPATRSIAFRRVVWDKIGGFDEKYSHNEDYVFAKKLRKEKFNIKFEKSAIAYWYPPKTLRKAFIMFFRFAYGDSEARIYRPKALFVLFRYLIGVLIIFLAIINGSGLLIIGLLTGFILYLLWSISKNYRYASGLRSLVFLPVLQLTSDIAVIAGTITARI